MFPFTGLDVTWASSIMTVDVGAIQSSEQKISWISYIWTLEFNQPIHLNIDSELTEMMIYSGVSYFFWERTPEVIVTDMKTIWDNIDEKKKYEKLVSYQKKDSHGQACPSFFWYDNYSGH